MVGTRAAKVVILAALTVATASVAVAGPAGAAAPPPRNPATFACPPGLTTPFTDVAGTTHAASIACALHYELTGGTTPTTYSPNAPVTRAQMATFLARTLFGPEPPPPDGPSDFTDTAGSPHEPNIQLLSELGLVLGTGGTSYSPNSPVTRAQMATFLARLLELVGFVAPASSSDHFTDDNGNVHQRNIQIVADAGITGGTTPTTFSPNAVVTRGAMASFLVRTIDLGVEEALFQPFVTNDAFAALTGAAPGATGTAVVYTSDVPGVICMAIDVVGIAAVDGVRIVAGAGPGGTALVDLPALPPGGRCFSDPDAAAIAANPAGHSVVIDTAQADGVLVGRLGVPGTTFAAQLSAAGVVPGPGDPSAAGIAAGFITSTPDVLCFVTLVGTDDPTSSVTGGVFEGAAHADGTLVHGLQPQVVGSSPLDSIVTNTGVECFVDDQAGAVAANPSAFYVEVASQSFPDGALRGQLTSVPTTFGATAPAFAAAIAD